MEWQENRVKRVKNTIAETDKVVLEHAALFQVATVAEKVVMEEKEGLTNGHLAERLLMGILAMLV